MNYLPQPSLQPYKQLPPFTGDEIEFINPVVFQGLMIGSGYHWNPKHTFLANVLYLLLVYNVLGVFRDLENLFCFSKNFHFSFSDPAHFLSETAKSGVYIFFL